MAEQQLAALMELGFHAEQALPLCDGVSPIEELVERLTLADGQALGDEGELFSDRYGVPYEYVDASATPRTQQQQRDQQGPQRQRRYQSLARRFMGGGRRQ